MAAFTRAIREVVCLSDEPASGQRYGAANDGSVSSQRPLPAEG